MVCACHKLSMHFVRATDQVYRRFAVNHQKPLMVRVRNKVPYSQRFTGWQRGDGRVIIPN